MFRDEFHKHIFQEISQIKKDKEQDTERLKKELHDKNIEHQKQYESKINELKLNHDQTIAKNEEERIKLKENFEKESVYILN